MRWLLCGLLVVGILMLTAAGSLAWLGAGNMLRVGGLRVSGGVVGAHDLAPYERRYLRQIGSEGLPVGGAESGIRKALGPDGMTFRVGDWGYRLHWKNSRPR
jgi:hypothetical protein